jgi:predicted metalloendopeptidase
VHKSARGLGRIDNDVIKGLWDMTADEANAYYSSELNKIVIPGGILSPPFFDGRLPTAFNFGTSPPPLLSVTSGWVSLTLAQAPSAP